MTATTGNGTMGSGDGNPGGGTGAVAALPTSGASSSIGRRIVGFVAVLLLLAVLKVAMDYLGVTSLIAQAFGKALQRLMSGVH